MCTVARLAVSKPALPGRQFGASRFPSASFPERSPRTGGWGGGRVLEGVRSPHAGVEQRRSEQDRGGKGRWVSLADLRDAAGLVSAGHPGEREGTTAIFSHFFGVHVGLMPILQM